MTNPGRLGESLGEIGEFGLIDAITADLGARTVDPRVIVGPGDDTAILAIGQGRAAVTVDVLVEGRHFRREWSSAEQIGAKAAAASLADLAAMGASPVALVVAFCAPSDLPTKWALACARGIADEAGRAGARVVGGDISAADQIVVSVTGIGDLQGRAPVLRSGARPGDRLAVCGRLGWSAAGLALLRAGAEQPALLIDDHRRPEPPYAAGVLAAEAGATAMIDISDGLIADARHIAQGSGVRIAMRSADLPVEPLLQEAAAVLGSPASVLAWICAGGEDHALLATFPGPVPAAFTVIGEVLAVQGEPEVWLDGAAVQEAGGHVHFRAD